MYSSVVLIMSATAFVFVQCDDVRSKEDLNYTKVSKVVSDCNTEYQKALRDAMKNTVCKPYERHVVLKPISGQTFYPPLVSVRRCDGIVAAGYVCAPIKTEIIQVPVSLSTSGSSNSCAFVSVEEHVKCTSQCKQRPEACKAKEELDETQCKCICKNQAAQRQKCIERSREWDEQDCQCTCGKQNTECTNGLTWNTDYCKCK